VGAGGELVGKGVKVAVGGNQTIVGVGVKVIVGGGTVGVSGIPVLVPLQADNIPVRMPKHKSIITLRLLQRGCAC
jgi:hypothetical protein